VAGVALMALGGALGLIWSPVTPRHFAWQVWHKLTSTVVLRGSRGTNAVALCVAGVAQTHIYSRFAWQAWHKLTSAVLCVAGVAQTHIYHRFAWQSWHKLTSTIVLRGRRGTDGSGWRAWSDLVARDAVALCVAGVAQTHIYHRFAWHAWHKLTSAALCVAGVAQALIYRRFVWQSWHKLTSTIVLRGRHGTDGSGWCALV